MNISVILSKSKNLVSSVIRRGPSLCSGQPLLYGFFALGMIGIFWTFFEDFGIGESGYNFLGKTKKVTLSPGEPVLQTFTARENNIHQIRIVLGNASIRRGEHIEFQLMDETCTKILAAIDFLEEPKKHGAYTIFPFPAIPDSKGKSYCFSTTYFANEKRKEDKPYISATEKPDPAFTDRMFYDSNKGKFYENQTLFFRPAYTRGSLYADLSNFLNRLSQYKPEFLKGWPILAIFLLLIIGSFALSIRIIRL